MGVCLYSDWLLLVYSLIGNLVMNENCCVSAKLLNSAKKHIKNQCRCLTQVTNGNVKLTMDTKVNTLWHKAAKWSQLISLELMSALIRAAYSGIQTDTVCLKQKSTQIDFHVYLKGVMQQGFSTLIWLALAPTHVSTLIKLFRFQGFDCYNNNVTLVIS